MFEKLSDEQREHLVRFGVNNEILFFSMRKMQKAENIICSICAEVEKTLKRKNK